MASCPRPSRVTLPIPLTCLVVLTLASCGKAVNPTAGQPSTQGAPVITVAPSAQGTPPSSSAPRSTAPPTSTTVTTSPAAPGIEVGPGPQPVYSVQTQPPAASCHYRMSGAFPLPDPSCTPGAINPQVTQGTIGSTICRSGYTSGIRPPESVTGPEKAASAAAYGYSGSFHTGEYDHLIPLELGGDPNDPANLWVEPNDRAGATSTYNSKDVLENRLKGLVCSGRLSLAAAQQAIATNWAGAYETYG